MFEVSEEHKSPLRADLRVATMNAIRKYPRTQHLAGSRLQAGDEDLDAVPMAALKGRHVVIEEKMDGANSGMSFSPDGELLLQSRGHFLTGGPRERQFNRLKQWATCLTDRLFDVIGDRHIVYGEWLYAKHTVYYDALPHYWMEFDVLDTATGEFLSTPRRAELLGGLPVVPVKVLYSGEWPGEAAVRAMVTRSHFITPAALGTLSEAAASVGCDVELTLRQTDPSGLMEGLYVKVEEGGVVTERYKFVRRDFVQIQIDQGHWLDRPLVPNMLADGAEMYSG
jgi:hypothetical protein